MSYQQCKTLQVEGEDIIMSVSKMLFGKFDAGHLQLEKVRWPMSEKSERDFVYHQYSLSSL